MSQEARSNKAEPVKSVKPRTRSTSQKETEQPAKRHHTPGKEASAAVKSVTQRIAPEEEYALAIAAPKILLYRDEDIIEEMRNRILATLRDSGILNRLRKRFQGHAPFFAGNFLKELAGVDEFALKPSAKFKLFAEIGANFEFKWHLADDKNIDNTILMLFSVIEPMRVLKVVKQPDQQKRDTQLEELIYPGRPINLKGQIHTEKDLLAESICLHDSRQHLEIKLAQDHKLNEIVSVLEGRNLYVLGLVQSVRPSLSINAGAILLVELPERKVLPRQ